MKLLFIGDAHFHAWPYGAKPTTGGSTSRFDQIHKSFEWALAKGTDIGADCTIFLGDLFHKKEGVPWTVFNPVMESIRNHDQRRLVLLKGNHDESIGDNEVHALQAFEEIPRVHVVDKPCWTIVRKHPLKSDDSHNGDPAGIILYMPFYRSHQTWLELFDEALDKYEDFLRRDTNENPELLRQLPKLLVCHNMLLQPRVGSSDFLMHDYVQIPVEKLQAFEGAIVGHVHDRQTLTLPGWRGQVHYPGSLCQFTFGDVGRLKFIDEFEITKKGEGLPEPRPYRNKHTPLFFKIQADDQQALENARDLTEGLDPSCVFIEVIGTSSKAVDQTQAEFEEQGFATRSKVEKPQEVEQRVNLTLDKGPAAAIEQYATARPHDTIDKSTLLKYGLEVLGSVTNE